MDKESNENKNTGEIKGKNSENNEWNVHGGGEKAGVGVASGDKRFFENRIEREWLSTEEAAHFLSVSENAIRIMVYRGQIQSYKFGRRLRFSVRDCRALFEKKGA